MDIVRRQHIWAGMMLALIVGCAPEDTEIGFVESTHFLSSVYNCEALDAVSGPICGDDSYAVHCAWKTSDQFATLYYATEVPAISCDQGVAEAIRRAWEEDLVCMISDPGEDARAACDEGGYTQILGCERIFDCFQR